MISRKIIIDLWCEIYQAEIVFLLNCLFAVPIFEFDLILFSLLKIEKGFKEG